MSGMPSRNPPSPPGRQRALVLAGIVAVVAAGFLLLARDDRPAGREAQARQARPFTAGRGMESARVLPALGRDAAPTVVFLHGWGLVGPKAYAAWIDHLRRRGSRVIVPRYQRDVRTPSPLVADAVLAGVRAAVSRLDADDRPREVVVIGHSVGAVLGIDYATRAEGAGLPRARAVLAIYPGGALRNMPAVAADASRLPPGSRFVVLASPADEVVGVGPAQQLFAAAAHLGETRRELVLIEDVGATDHFAPARANRPARTAFWRVADRLIADGA